VPAGTPSASAARLARPARRLSCSHRAASLRGPPALLSFSPQIVAVHLRHHELEVVHTLYYGRRPELLGGRRIGRFRDLEVLSSAVTTK
jgi:hypothetical protein